MRLNRVKQSLLIASFAASCFAGSGGTPTLGTPKVGVVPATIGVATAVGTFRVNSSEVQGNANVFEGSELRTGKAASQIYLQNGAAVTLGRESAGTIYKDHFILQEGVTRVDNMGAYSVHAAIYRIQADQPTTKALVRLAGDDVEIAALTGSVAVLNQKGAMLTHVGAGTASAFNKNQDIVQSTNPAPNYENRAREAALYAALVASMAGLGLAVDAVLQSGPYTGSLSP